MSDERLDSLDLFVETLDRYRRGDCDASAISEALRHALAAMPARAGALLTLIDAAQADGTLTLAQQRALTALIRLRDDSTPDTADDDGHTRFAAARTGGPPGNDATGISSGHAGSPPDGKTVVRPAAGARRVAPEPVPAGDTDTSSGTGNTSGGTTGSGWTHPERWDGPDAQEMQPGMIIKGRFVLQEVVGRGGMGVVFKALDQRKEEAQDRNPFVAIKVLNEEFRRHPESLKALQREARKSQSLAHPNVVNVFDFDRDGATVFMTMEFLDGKPLNRLLREEFEHGLPFAEAVPIIQGMAQALIYAHSNGVVHSDFKPGNVFLNRDGGVKVFDFGIAQAAKHLDGQATDDQTLFDAGSLGALTPAYASLEMLEGGEPDPRDDLYALGCVVYELLTGQHPFDKLPADEALKKKLTPAPVKGLSRRRQRALRRALAFKRENRSPDVESFLRELTEKRRARWPFVAAGVLALAALGGIAAFIIYPNYIPPRQTDNLIADLRSGKPAVVARALDKLKTLKPDARVIITHEVHSELVAYFKARIAEVTDTDQGHFDFPKAEALLKRAHTLYPDSAELTALGGRLVERRNRLLNQYTQQLNERLIQGHLLPSDGQAGVDHILKIVAQIDPGSVLLHDPRLPFAFAHAAERALAAADYKRASMIAASGLQRFPDNVALINVRDEARIQLDQIDRNTLIAQLRTHLRQALPDLRTLADFAAVRDDAARLAALAPAEPVVADLRTRLQPVLEQALAQMANAHDWHKAKALLQRYASLVEPAFLKRHSAHLAAARDEWQAHLTQTESEFSDALTKGELAGPDASSATALLAQLTAMGESKQRLRWAHASLAIAWLDRARAARAAGHLDAATKAIHAARAQSPNGSVADAIEAEQAAIEQAKQEPPASDHWRVVRLSKNLNDTFARSELTPQTANAALAVVNNLATLVPDDPLVTDARSQLAAGLIAAASARSKAGDWRHAEETLSAAVALFPESMSLLQALDHARAQLSQQSSLAHLAQVREQQKAVMDLIAKPAFDVAWDKQLHGRLGALATTLQPGSKWLDDTRSRVANLYLQHVLDLIRSQHFTDAEAMLARGKAFANLPGFATAEKSLKEDEAAFARQRADKAQHAQVAALKHTLITAAKANDVEAAGKALSEVKTLLPADDAFVAKTAPGLIASAYARLAARLAKRGQYDDAAKLASSGLKLDAHDDRLKHALARYQWHSLAQQVETAFGGDRALNQPGIEAALKTLKAGQPDLYPAAEKRFVDALVKSIARISKTNRAAAQRRLSIGRALFPHANRIATLTTAGAAVAASSSTSTKDRGGESSPRPCRANLAGYGRRARGTCYDVIGGSTRGPLMVVVPAGGSVSAPLAIGKYEISVGDYDAYCKLSGQCKAITGVDADLPVTNISFKDAQRYAHWLSERTGYRYRIPDVATWQYAATAGGHQPSGGFNCQVRIGGKLVKGFNLVSVTTGDENGWGLVNYLGNAQEWARSGNRVVALGGSYEDPLSKCRISLRRTTGPRPDPATGFRLVRSLSPGSE